MRRVARWMEVAVIAGLVLLSAGIAVAGWFS